MGKSQKHYAKRSQTQMTSYYDCIYMKFQEKTSDEKQISMGQSWRDGIKRKGKRVSNVQADVTDFFWKKAKDVNQNFHFTTITNLFSHIVFFLGGGGQKSFKISNIDHLRVHINLYPKNKPGILFQIIYFITYNQQNILLFNVHHYWKFC